MTSLCWVALSAATLAAQQLPPGARQALMVDDRGAPIAASLEICATRGTTRTCETRLGSEPFPLPAFDLLTAEGSEHGPATFRSGAVKPGGNNVLRLTVPRKALLRVITSPPERPLAVSLYRSDDPDFRRPTFRAPLGIVRELLIPAGDLVLSLASPGAAPDLHLVAARPGSRVAVRYQARSGWSLLVRATAAVDRQPIAEAAIDAQPAEGYGDPHTGASVAHTALSGLAALSGLHAPLVLAAVSRGGYVTQRVAGLTASPGTFAFHEVSLERPGSVRVRMQVDGKPGQRASCRITAPTARASLQQKRVAPRVMFEGVTDAAGVCRALALPAGTYQLRLAPAGAAHSGHLQSIRVEGGHQTDVDAALISIPLGGAVTRGQDAAPGLKVRVGTTNPQSVLEATAEAVTDEKGEYRVILWSAGEYFVHLQTGSGWLADSKRIWVERGGATCDFHLSPAGLHGKITDSQGDPVTGATVSLRWNQSRLISGNAGPDGTFDLSLPEGGGEAVLRAFHPEYQPGEPVTVTVPADGPPSPVTLVLTKGKSLSGIVVSAAGGPVANAWIAAYPAAAAENVIQLGSTITDSAGRFTLPRTAGDVVRLFVTGPGCALHAVDVPAAAGASVDPAADDSLTVTCGPVPANFSLTLVDSAGHPVANEGVLLRRGGVAIPPEVLATHLSLLGLPTTSDDVGRLVLAGLEPGDYAIFLEGAANPLTMSADLPDGRLAATSLAPLQTAEIEVTVERQP